MLKNFYILFLCIFFAVCENQEHTAKELPILSRYEAVQMLVKTVWINSESIHKNLAKRLFHDDYTKCEEELEDERREDEDIQSLVNATLHHVFKGTLINNNTESCYHDIMSLRFDIDYHPMGILDKILDEININRERKIQRRWLSKTMYFFKSYDDEYDAAYLYRIRGERMLLFRIRKCIPSEETMEFE